MKTALVLSLSMAAMALALSSLAMQPITTDSYTPVDTQPTPTTPAEVLVYNNADWMLHNDTLANCDQFGNATYVTVNCTKYNASHYNQNHELQKTGHGVHTFKNVSNTELIRYNGSWHYYYDWNGSTHHVESSSFHTATIDNSSGEK